MLSVAARAFHKPEVNREFISAIISSGRPCRWKTSVMNNSAKPLAVVEMLQGTKCDIFVRRSSTIQMASKPCDSGSWVMKSIEMDRQEW